MGGGGVLARIRGVPPPPHIRGVENLSVKPSVYSHTFIDRVQLNLYINFK